ncbi:hypothetical protein [Desulfosarcina cetonica]|nr:hypothetical protein [Desulfosarcina cetonica]
MNHQNGTQVQAHGASHEVIECRTGRLHIHAMQIDVPLDGKMAVMQAT